MYNEEIAAILEHYAQLLEVSDSNEFRVRAYRNAAYLLRDLPDSIDAMLAAGEDLTQLPGIGDTLAEKIQEIAHSGHLAALDELAKQIPSGLIALMNLPDIGPKRVKQLHQELGITTLAELRNAAERGEIRKLKGFGAKSEAKLLKAVKQSRDNEHRIRLLDAEPIAAALVNYLSQCKAVTRAVVAGSFRRRKETVGDLDILVVGNDANAIMNRFIAYPDLAEVVAHGNSRSTILLKNGLQIDLRLLPESSYGAGLYYFTGSKAHNIAVRSIALQRGLKINERGVFKDDKQIAGATETDVFASVGLAYIEPELRENRGEIEAAQSNQLPDLLTLRDIQGDLHTHTLASDGKDNLRSMAEAAKARGYRYLAITDHSQHLAIAHGLDEKRLRRQLAAIDQLNAELKGIRILKGTEVDILADGTLDLNDAILKELDLTVCAIHYQFEFSAKQQTDRILRAMDNPYFNILGHPHGRLLGKRPAYAVEIERLLSGARERSCFLEVNAQPDRLDLDDVYCKLAKDIGVKIAISSDAHSVAALDGMRYGVDQARRGWLSAEDVLNTRPWGALKKLLKRH